MLKGNKKIGGFLVMADEPLGHGTFGQVYKCIEEATSNVFAMKIISKQLGTSKFK